VELILGIVDFGLISTTSKTSKKKKKIPVKYPGTLFFQRKYPRT